jgi:hypothetical protein
VGGGARPAGRVDASDGGRAARTIFVDVDTPARAGIATCASGMSAPVRKFCAMEVVACRMDDHARALVEFRAPFSNALNDARNAQRGGHRCGVVCSIDSIRGTADEAWALRMEHSVFDIYRLT